jgi:SsrA-binding protein
MGRTYTKYKGITKRYEILEIYEAGIVLTGAEVKSIKNHQASLKGSYVRIRNGEAWLVGMSVGQYTHARAEDFEKDRDRKLLLRQKQIDKLEGHIRRKSYTVIPLSLYDKNGYIKVKIALAKGLRKYQTNKRKRREKKYNRERIKELVP